MKASGKTITGNPGRPRREFGASYLPRQVGSLAPMPGGVCPELCPPPNPTTCYGVTMRRSQAHASVAVVALGSADLPDFLVQEQ